VLEALGEDMSDADSIYLDCLVKDTSARFLHHLVIVFPHPGESLWRWRPADSLVLFGIVGPGLGTTGGCYPSCRYCDWVARGYLTSSQLVFSSLPVHQPVGVLLQGQLSPLHCSLI
jgi:hypothetical protein